MVRGLVGLAMVVLTAGPALSADLTGYSPSQCLTATQSQIELLPVAEVELRVSNFYDEAGAALDDGAVVGSRSPAFLWARETRFQCGNALGYLSTGHVDTGSVGKCDCAHSRLVSFR